MVTILASTVVNLDSTTEVNFSLVFIENIEKNATLAIHRSQIIFILFPVIHIVPAYSAEFSPNVFIEIDNSAHISQN